MIGIKLIKKNNRITRIISETYQIDNFLTERDCKYLSIAVSKAKNHSEITKNIKSDRVYYILRGKLFALKGNKKYIAEKGDILFIPKNTKYQFQGTFEAVLINSPAFDPKNEKIFVKTG